MLTDAHADTEVAALKEKDPDGINLSRNKFPRGNRLLIVIAVFVIVVVFLGLWMPRSTSKVRIVGVLRYTEELEQVEKGFYLEMEDLGYKDGENIRYIVTPYGEGPEKMQALAQELVDEHADILVAITGVAATGAKKATEISGRTDIPIVFSHANTPDATGLIKSFASSGNNLTGVAVNFIEVTAKKLEFLKRVNPLIKRVGILDANFTDPAGKFVQNELQKMAPQFGIEVVPYRVVNNVGPEATAEIAMLIEQMKPGDIDAFFYLPGPVSNPPQNVQLIIQMAQRLKIPTTFIHNPDVEQGGLFGYGHDLATIGKQTAIIMDKVLRGQLPSDIPIEFPEKNILIINLATARTIEVAIPESLLNIADIKIEQ